MIRMTNKRKIDEIHEVYKQQAEFYKTYDPIALKKEIEENRKYIYRMIQIAPQIEIEQYIKEQYGK